MSFIFPEAMRHRPNQMQLELLCSVTHNGTFPGFFNDKALTISTNNQNDRDMHYNYLMTSKNATETLKNFPYLYIPYDHTQYFIMQDRCNVAAVVRTSSLSVYWFEYPMSLGEICSAQRQGIPIIVGFRYIGNNSQCPICVGCGAVDWVENMLLRTETVCQMIPDDPYLYVAQNHHLFLVDAKWILNYKGDNIIYVCPICYGTASKAMVYSERDQMRLLEEQQNVVNNDAPVNLIGSRKRLIDRIDYKIKQPFWN